MNVRKTLVAPSALLMIFASNAAVADAKPTVIGMGVGATSSVYKDMDDKSTAVPLVSYQNGNFWLNGVTAGYTVMKGKNWALSPVVTLDTGVALDTSDAKRGTKLYDGLDDRDSGVGYGLYLDYNLGWAKLGTAVINDSESSYSVDMNLNKNIQVSNSLTLTPGVNLTYRSSGYNDHYYGISASEANAIRTRHNAGAGVDAGVKLDARYAVNQNWAVVGRVGVTRLSNEAADSDLVDDDTRTFGLIGVTYSFF